MAYLHKFYLVIDGTNFTYPTVINNGLVFDVKKDNTGVAGYVKGFITRSDSQTGFVYIYGESISSAAINVALGDNISVDIHTIPSLGDPEALTAGFISAEDLTVDNILISTDVSGVATTADVNAAGNAIISLLDGTTPLQV